MSLLQEMAHERADARVTPPDDPELAKECPNLWEFLTEWEWGNGERRVLPRIVIDRAPGGYVVTLQDDSLMAKLSVQCLTLSEAARALEAAMTSSHPGWLHMEKSFRNKKGIEALNGNAVKGARRKRR
jgi:hypothetical protein